MLSAISAIYPKQNIIEMSERDGTLIFDHLNIVKNIFEYLNDLKYWHTCRFFNKACKAIADSLIFEKIQAVCVCLPYSKIENLIRASNAFNSKSSQFIIYNNDIKNAFNKFLHVYSSILLSFGGYKESFGKSTDFYYEFDNAYKRTALFLTSNSDKQMEIQKYINLIEANIHHGNQSKVIEQLQLLILLIGLIEAREGNFTIALFILESLKKIKFPLAYLLQLKILFHIPNDSINSANLFKKIKLYYRRKVLIQKITQVIRNTTEDNYYFLKKYQLKFVVWFITFYKKNYAALDSQLQKIVISFLNQSAAQIYPRQIDWILKFSYRLGVILKPKLGAYNILFNFAKTLIKANKNKMAFECLIEILQDKKMNNKFVLIEIMELIIKSKPTDDVNNNYFVKSLFECLPSLPIKKAVLIRKILKQMRSYHQEPYHSLISSLIPECDEIIKLLLTVDKKINDNKRKTTIDSFPEGLKKPKLSPVSTPMILTMYEEEMLELAIAKSMESYDAEQRR